MTDLEHIAEIFAGYEGVPDGYGRDHGYRSFRRVTSLRLRPDLEALVRGRAVRAANVVKTQTRETALVEGRLARKAALRARVGR